MIVTFTANPSLDRTVTLGEPLSRGQVHRVTSVTVEPGGKGVNVARCVHSAGQEVLALLPAGSEDSILGAIRAIGLPYEAVTIGQGVRTNLTITEGDGTTTKINEPGPTLDADQLAACRDLVTRYAASADWVVLSGSLPPGAPDDFYATLAPELRALGCQVAIDTSDAPLQAVVDALPASACDLIKPNSEELAQLTGGDPEQLEATAKAGDPGPVIEAARSLQARGITSVLATLGGAGAVLVTADGAWHAAAPAITVKSTVGAGDSSVAGFVLAAVAGGTPEQCLARAVAYGSAAASLAGTALPRPEDADPDAVVVTRVD